MKAFLKSLVLGMKCGVAAAAMLWLGAIAGLADTGWAWPVFALSSVVCTSVFVCTQRIVDIVHNRTRTLRTRADHLRRLAGDIHGMVRLGPYMQSMPLPFGGGWALTGDSAAIIARELKVRNASSVLELGSGVSTLIIAQIMRDRGHGHVVSVDHDPFWAELTRRNLRVAGLDDFVTVIDAPLSDVIVGPETMRWYGIPAGALQRFAPFDALLVDGPPQAHDDVRLARFPAMPLLHQLLSPQAVVFVDDAARPTERLIVERWLQNFDGWSSFSHDTVDGLCIMERQSGH